MFDPCCGFSRSWVHIPTLLAFFSNAWGPKSFKGTNSKVWNIPSLAPRTDGTHLEVRGILGGGLEQNCRSSLATSCAEFVPWVTDSAEDELLILEVQRCRIEAKASAAQNVRLWHGPQMEQQNREVKKQLQGGFFPFSFPSYAFACAAPFQEMHPTGPSKAIARHKVQAGSKWGNESIPPCACQIWSGLMEFLQSRRPRGLRPWYVGANDLRFKWFWLSGDLRFKWFWLSVDLRFKWFRCEMIWVTGDLAVKRFEIQMILVVFWFWRPQSIKTHDLNLGRCQNQCQLLFRWYHLADPLLELYGGFVFAAVAPCSSWFCFRQLLGPPF